MASSDRRRDRHVIFYYPTLSLRTSIRQSRKATGWMRMMVQLSHHAPNRSRVVDPSVSRPAHVEMKRLQPLAGSISNATKCRSRSCWSQYKPAGSHDLLRQAQCQCCGLLKICRQRLASGSGGVWCSTDGTILGCLPSFFRDLCLDSDSFGVFFLSCLVIRIASPNLHWRLDKVVWARTREL